MNSITFAFAVAGIHAVNDNTLADVACVLADKQKKFKEGWSFSGSYKTYQALKAQGKIS